MWKRTERFWGRVEAPAVVLALALTAMAGLLPALQPLEQKLYDLRARWISRQMSPDERIAIIAIDEKSLQRMQSEHGPWPWSRELYGPVLERCRLARTVAVDLLFAESEGEAAAQEDLFAGLTGAPTNVVLATVLTAEHTGSGGGGDPSPLQIAPAVRDSLELVSYAVRIPPAARYEARVAATGFANYLTDTDGIVRGHLLVAEAGGQYFPSLALQAWCRFQGATEADIELARDRLSVRGQSVPIDRHARYAFVPVQAEYQTVSFVDVLDGAVPAEAFAGKLVFLGSTAAGLQGDRQVTSIHVYAPGVRVLAWAADGLLNQRCFRFLPGWPALALAMLLAAAPFRLPLGTPSRAAGSLALHLGALTAMTLGGLRVGFWMLPAAWLGAATVTGHAAAGTVGWLADRRRRRQLEELEQQKQQFTDMLIHDLRNQLAPVEMAFSIEEESARKAAAASPAHLGAAQQSLARTLVMLNTLLDIRRTEDGRMPVTPSTFLLHDLLESLATTYRGMTTRRHLTIQTRVAGDPPTVELDRELLQRILENLLLNALQYAAKDTTIEIEATLSPGQAVVELRNLGPAIPPDEQERIFDLFGTGADTKRRRFGGTGIGLAFCRLAMDAMGGTVDIHSPWQGDQGVRIVLTLPQRSG